jgi:hypothetical protein
MAYEKAQFSTKTRHTTMQKLRLINTHSAGGIKIQIYGNKKFRRRTIGGSKTNERSKRHQI